MTRGAKNVTLWVAQILLALFFLAAGVYHGLLPIEEAAKSAPWADDLPVPLVRFIGFSELAGALGVVLPWLTGFRPSLTPLAALGLMTIMLLAVLFHAVARRGGHHRDEPRRGGHRGIRRVGPSLITYARR